MFLSDFLVPFWLATVAPFIFAWNAVLLRVCVTLPRSSSAGEVAASPRSGADGLTSWLRGMAAAAKGLGLVDRVDVKLAEVVGVEVGSREVRCLCSSMLVLMRYCAMLIDSGVPVIVTDRSLEPSSELEILIVAPDNCLISLILAPPLPMMQPIRSLGMVISCVCVWVAPSVPGRPKWLEAAIAANA